MRPLVIRLAVQRELEIVSDVVVSGIDLRRIGQLRQLSGERLIELGRMPAVVTVAGAGIEQRIAAG